MARCVVDDAGKILDKGLIAIHLKRRLIEGNELRLKGRAFERFRKKIETGSE